MTKKLTATAVAALALALALALATPSLVAPPVADSKPKPSWLKKCSPREKEKDVKVISRHGRFVFYAVAHPDYGFQDASYVACNAELGRGRVIAFNRQPTRVRFRELSVTYRAHFCDGPSDEKSGRHYYRDTRLSLKRNRVLFTGPVVYSGRTCITDEDRD